MVEALRGVTRSRLPRDGTSMVPCRRQRSGRGLAGATVTLLSSCWRTTCISNRGELGPQAVTPAAPERYPVADLASATLVETLRPEGVWLRVADRVVVDQHRRDHDQRPGR